MNTQKKRRKAKKGYTYVLAIFIASSILITSTATLALISNDYRNRINESKEVKNIYEAEAGIDLVYNLIVKNCDAAVVYSNNSVYEKFNDDDKVSYNKLNEEFKNSFMEFLGEDELSPEKGFQWALGEKKYMKPPKDIPVEVVDEIKYMANKGNYEMSSEGINIDKNNSEISIVGFEVDKDNQRIIVSIRSTFFNSSNQAGGLENKKVIETKYTIKAPDYSDNVNLDPIYEEVNNYQIEKGLFVDGDLNITNSEITINGTAWVKGRDTTLDENSYYAYDKYKGGIKINNSKLKVNGVISTNNTISLVNKAGMEVSKPTNENIVDEDIEKHSGNLYTENIYLGAGRKILIQEEKVNYKDNYINIAESIVANNDMTIDAKDSKVTVTNYYGISDKREKVNGIKKNAANNSSSIIINTNDNSSVKITKNAYVNGLAYIDFNEGQSFYRTGESIAVIGNYVAYTKRLLSDGKYDVRFKEHIVSRSDNEVTMELIELVDEDKDDYNFKVEHFKEYYEDSQNFIKKGGIEITDKLYSIGAGVNKNTTDKVSVSSVDDINEMIEETNKKKIEYGTNVYNLGYSNLEGSGKELYEEVQSGKSLIKTIESQIDYNELTNKNTIDKSTIESEVNLRYGHLILDGDDSKKGKSVLIIEDGILKKSINGSEEKIGDLKSIDPAYKGKVKAVIITKGDLIIRGDTNIVGCVIVGGDLYIENQNKNSNKSLSITYNRDIINNIVAFNGTEYKDIFKDGAYKKKGEPVKVKVGQKSMISDDLSKIDAGWFDARTYLKQGLWKLKENQTSIMNKSNIEDKEED